MSESENKCGLCKGDGTTSFMHQGKELRKRKCRRCKGSKLEPVRA